MRTAIVALLLLTISFTPGAIAVCASGALCVGEATQPCGGPAPYGEGWVGFTGAWGEAAGVEYGVGGWDRCSSGYWVAGAFVNMDSFPAGSYQTVSARFDSSPGSAKPCYLSAGAYGRLQQSWAYGCPEGTPVPHPAWGALLP